jgi:hypothetical protein
MSRAITSVTTDPRTDPPAGHSVADSPQYKSTCTSVPRTGEMWNRRGRNRRRTTGPGTTRDPPPRARPPYRHRYRHRYRQLVPTGPRQHAARSARQSAPSLPVPLPPHLPGSSALVTPRPRDRAHFSSYTDSLSARLRVIPRAKNTRRGTHTRPTPWPCT